MPFTPFHFGPGLLFKSTAPQRFSFSSFALTQIVIDVETLYYIVRSEWPLHRILHTFSFGIVVGAVIGTLVSASSFWLGRIILRPGVPIIQGELNIAGALIGGIVGGVSHSLLDSIMHADVEPLRPFLAGNQFYQAVGTGALHIGCVVAGVLGLLLLVLRTGAWKSAD